jgi:uncharacterized protein YeaO (DUF488 family)
MTKMRKRTTRPRRRKPGGSIAIKRAYDKPAANDGLRILVDRLWPRGLTKAALKVDAWPKQLAPSTELRRWYQHDPERYGEFRRRYLAELKDKREAFDELRRMLRGHKATLITATHELELSQASVLRAILLR